MHWTVKEMLFHSNSEYTSQNRKKKNGFVYKNWREARKRSLLLLSKFASAVHRCVAPLSANQHCVTAGFLEHVLVTQSRQGENTGYKWQSHGTTLNLREIYNSKVIVFFSGKKNPSRSIAHSLVLRLHWTCCSPTIINKTHIDIFFVQ